MCVNISEDIERAASRMLSIRSQYRRILWPLGGAHEIGRSCFFLSFGGKNFLIDCGIKAEIGGIKYPYFSVLSQALVKGNLHIDAVLISHAHVDHVGALAKLFKYINPCPVYMTKSTRKAADVMLKDSQNVRSEMGLPFTEHCSDQEFSLNSVDVREAQFNKPIEFGDVTVTFLNAGHIPGSAMMLFRFQDKSLLYTGDIKLSGSTLLDGADLDGVSQIDYVVVEGTYIDYESVANTLQEEERLVAFINKVVGRGGKVLIPVYSLGRAQEILALIHKGKCNGGIPPDTPVYLFGLARSVSMALQEDLLKAGVDLKFDVDQRDFGELPQSELSGSVILATPGRMTGGISASLALQVAREPESGIAVVGYQDEMSPGKMLLEALDTHKIVLSNGNVINLQCEIQRFGISAHSSWDEILKFLHKCARKSILVHTETRKRPVDVWRFPKNLDVIVLKNVKVRGYSQHSERISAEVEDRLQFARFSGEFDILTDREEVYSKIYLVAREILSEGTPMLTPRIFEESFQLLVQVADDEQAEAIKALLEKRGFINVSYEKVNLKKEIVRELPFIIDDRFSKITSFLGISGLNPPNFKERRLLDTMGDYGLFNLTNNTILLDPRLKFDKCLLEYVVDHEIAHYIMWQFLQKYLAGKVKGKWDKSKFIEGFAEWVAVKMGHETQLYAQSEEYRKGRKFFEDLELKFGTQKIIEILTKKSTLEEVIAKLAELKDKPMPLNLSESIVFSSRAIKNFLKTFGGYSLAARELQRGNFIWIDRIKEFTVFLTPKFAFYTKSSNEGFIIIGVLEPTIEMYDKMILEDPYVISESPKKLLGDLQPIIYGVQQAINSLKQYLSMIENFLDFYSKLDGGNKLIENDIAHAKNASCMKGLLNMLRRRRAKKVLEKLYALQKEVSLMLSEKRETISQLENLRNEIIGRISKQERMLQLMENSKSPLRSDLIEAFISGTINSLLEKDVARAREEVSLKESLERMMAIYAKTKILHNEAQKI